MKMLISKSLLLALSLLNVAIKASESFSTPAESAASSAHAVSKPAAKHTAISTAFHTVKKAASHVASTVLHSNSSALLASSSSQLAKGSAAIAAWRAKSKARPASTRQLLYRSSETNEKTSADIDAHKTQSAARPRSRYSLTLSSRSSESDTSSASSALSCTSAVLPHSSSDNSSSATSSQSSHLAAASSSTSLSSLSSSPSSLDEDRKSAVTADNLTTAANSSLILKELIQEREVASYLALAGFFKKECFEPLVETDGTVKRDSVGRVLGWLPIERDQPTSDAIMIAVSIHESGCCIYMVDDKGENLPFGLVFSKNAGYIHSALDLVQCKFYKCDWVGECWYHGSSVLESGAFNSFWGTRFKRNLRNKIKYPNDPLNPFEKILVRFLDSSIYLHGHKNLSNIWFKLDLDKDIVFYITECRSGNYNDLSDTQKDYWLAKYEPQHAQIMKQWLRDKIKNIGFSNLFVDELIKQYMVEYMLEIIIRLNTAREGRERFHRGLHDLKSLDYERIQKKMRFPHVLREIDCLEVQPLHSNARERFNEILKADLEENDTEGITASGIIEAIYDKQSSLKKTLSDDLKYYEEMNKSIMEKKASASV